MQTLANVLTFVGMSIPESPPGVSLESIQHVWNDEAYQSFAKDAYDNYWYWSDFKYRAQAKNLDPQLAWEITRQRKLLSAKTIDLGTPKAHFRPSWNVTEDLEKVLHEYDMGGGGIVGVYDQISPKAKAQYLTSSLMEEAIASSQMEGAATTREVAKEMLRTGRKARNQDELMIRNNYDAMKWIGENCTQPLNLDTILTLHRIVTRGTLRKEEFEGALRLQDDVRVVDGVTGTVVHYPPESKEVPNMLSKVVNFINSEKPFVHPIIKGIMLHFCIGYIHPFVDGNGRTARTLFYWYLMKKGYWLVEYMSISRIMLKKKAQYAKAYLHSELDRNDLTYFLRFNIKTLNESLAELHKYLERKENEKQLSNVIILKEGVNPRQALILQALQRMPLKAFTIDEAADRTSSGYFAARNDLLELVERGYLKRMKLGKTLYFSKGENKVDTDY